MKDVDGLFKLLIGSQTRRALIGLFCGWLLVPMAFGVVETHEFENEQQRIRYQAFIQELRCPKCQNQNLSGSNSPIASDLRRELHRMITENESDDLIVKFMVDRYGEFVLYRPPLDKNTLILWGAPATLLFFGLIVLSIYTRRVSALANSDTKTLETAPLTVEEKQKLKDLLGEDYD